MGGSAKLGTFRRLNVPVRPIHFETPHSYLTRLCAANGVDQNFYVKAIRVRRQATGDSAALGHAIHELGGPSPHHWALSHQKASTGLANARGIRDPFGRQRSSRVACTHCAQGADVTTYDHIRAAVCLKHRRWVGRGTTATTQRDLRGRADLVAVERAARRLTADAWIDLDLYGTCWEAIRDWNYMTGQWRPDLEAAAEAPTFLREVDDRLALYPETVRLLRMVSNPVFRGMCDPGKGGATRRRAWMHRELAWLPAERWIVAEAVEEWVEDRQSRLAVVGETSDTFATPGPGVASLRTP